MGRKGLSVLCLLFFAVSQGIQAIRGGCGIGKFACSNGQCVNLAWRCDGTGDCADNSDELNCPPPACTPQQFRCVTSGECISSDFVCDGERDCSDGSDEQRTCGGRTCSPSQFTCREGQCIPGTYRCDHVKDCLDNSDENSCNYPQCTEKTCANGACYMNSQHCNGLLDCRDGSDEVNCAAHCPLHQHQCANGHCIPMANVCDQWDDCGDNSDEQGCEYRSCSGSEFSCTSRRCIPQGWVCDQFNDCGDYSDEEGCDSNSRDCYPGEWGCPGSPACIPFSKVCDGRPDCPRGADEANTTAEVTCSLDRCAALSCEYLCHSSPQGGACYCPDGFIVANDSRSCVDFDDCTIWGLCDQVCEDRPGSHHCSCVDGYFLEQGHICRANLSAGVPQLIYTNGGDVMMADLHGRMSRILVPSQGRGYAVGVAYHWNSQTVFWSDTNTQKVYSANFNGGDIRTVLADAVHSAQNLAVDWINFKLYVLEARMERIDMCDFDGGNRVTLVAENLLTPHGLALDPTVGYMFFTDMGYLSENMKLERAYMDGSNRVALVKKRLGIPTGITLDIRTQRIYWSDSHFDLVESVTYSGLNRKTVINGGTQVPYPFGMALFENHVFFTDWNKMAVIRTNRFNGSDPTLLYGTTKKPGHIVVSHPLLQPHDVMNPCGRHNGGCQQICVLSHRSDNQGLGFRCKCRLGYDLQADRQTCFMVKDFLLLATGLAVRGVPLNVSLQEDVTLPLTGLALTFSGSAVEYDGREEAILYNDRGRGLVYKSHLNGSGTQILTGNRVGMVDAMAYDWTSKILFWTTSSYKTVVAFRVPDKSRRDIVTGLRNPKGIAVHPKAGYLFWSDWYRPAVIMRGYTDGSHGVPLVNTTLGWPYGLTVDYMMERLYWVDALLDQIGLIGIYGNDRQTFTSIGQITQPYSLTIHSEYLYVSDTRTKAVFRMRKRDGGDNVMIRKGINAILNIKAYSSDRQLINSDCNRQLNGLCSHFCFPTPSGRACGCPYGMKLQPNNRDCMTDGSVTPPDTICGAYSFECDQGRCRPNLYRCDGIADCVDKTDEANCTNPGVTCSPRAFTCDNKHCILSSWKCDGHDDCGDGSDEVGCPTRVPTTCASNFFTCSNLKCVSYVWRCDGNNDCGDGSDEHNCNSTISSCPSGYFLCPDHRCISGSMVCDGDLDCMDGSDENNCEFACASYEFACASGDQCLNMRYKCDRVFDCRDHSDEQDCPTHMPGLCHDNEFQCQGDGSCLPAAWECDGHADCEDGSDEHSSCPPVTCRPGSVQCSNNNMCIPASWYCDGDNDCRDMSDEENCPTPPFRCPVGRWLCPTDQVCVAEAEVCDGQRDCPDGADESPLCNQDDCALSHGGCSDGCIQGPFGAQCTCPAGYQLLNDSKTCADVDECLIPGFCSQQCFNERGTFRCYCLDGYQLEPNGRTCKATDPLAAVLLVAKRSQILASHINMKPPLLNPIAGGSGIVAVDFDRITSRIFWADATQKKIWSSSENGTDKREVFSSGLMVPESIAVDWVGRNLYWTDSVMENIEVSTLDGAFRKVLLSKNVSRPRGLVLDPRTHINQMFWSDWGQNPRIERADMDGAVRQVIVSTKLYWPNGLALDYTTRRVYFADAYLKYIDYCDYEGNNRQQVLASDLVLQHPHGMTVFEDHVYWSERYTHKVMRSNKFHGGNTSTLLSGIAQPLGLALKHPVKQPPATSPCVYHLCSQLCLLSALRPRYYSCHCQSGWTLEADKRTCVKDNNPFLMVVRESVILGISLDPTDTSNNAMAPVAGITQGRDIEFDDREQFVYWVQSTGSIWRVKTNGTNRTQFAPAAIIGSPSGLAFDWMSRIMYYTNPTGKSIEVIRVDGSQLYRRTLIASTGKPDGAGEPVGLALDPARGKLYWTDKGSDSGVPPKVSSADMDGGNPKNLYTGNLAGIGTITADVATSRLYWAVANTGLIEYGTMDGASRMTLVSGLSLPWGLTVYQGHLYYTDADYEVVERVDKESGGGLVVMRSGLDGLRALKVHARDESAGSSNACSNNGGCSHLCLPRPASQKTCACTTGFVLSTDGSSCRQYKSFAIVSTPKLIRGFHINSSDHSEAMVPVGGNSYSVKDRLDVHVDSNFVYWTDNSTSSRGIYRAKTDGSQYRRLLYSGVGKGGIQGIAVDWIAGNLYFTNAFQRQTYLEVLAINTTYRMVLLKAASQDRPRDLAVSPKLRCLFWTDGGQNPKIERALLDGTNRSVLASESLGSPRGLTVDHASDFLYWTDDTLDMISRMAPDGTQRQIVRYGSRLPSPTGMAIFGGYVVWVDRKLGKLLQASKDPANTDPPEVIRDGIDGLSDVAVFDPATQPTSANLVGFNPCHEHNGGCQQLCFAMPAQEEPRCACAHGSLLSNGVTCGYGLDEFLVFTTATTLGSLRLDPQDHSSPFPSLTLGSNLLALDYDYTAKRLFFAQSMGIGRSRIGYVTTTAISSPPVTLAANLDNPQGVAYDWIHKRLYWTDYHRRNIQAIGTEGGNRSVVTQASRPKSIIVDPCYGYLYWSDWGPPAKIERVTLGGNYRIAIINSSLSSPSGLTLDVHQRMLYWADSTLDKIERSTLKGQDRQVVLLGVQYPFALSVYQQDLFFTDWTTRSVYRAGKDDGSGLTVLAQELQYQPHDIHVFTQAKQELCSSPCQLFNGGCSHVCVAGPSGPECQCPYQGSWYLANNGKDCIQDSGAPRCQAEQFTCLSGACISVRSKCDGFPDCQDKSDELERVCAFHTCSVQDFTCDNGHCVLLAYACDYMDDCGDNSDERGCPFPTCGPVGEFTCASGRCISDAFVCDGFNDCRDNATSDEINCPDRTCPTGQIKCENTNICIHSDDLCDGYNNCGDNSDENPLFCEGRTCSSDEFLCDLGMCIPSFWVCDSYKDCSDGMDEPPTCEDQVRTCGPSQFTCTNGNCVPQSMTCDGSNDCGDNSDEAPELQCGERTCSSSQFTCPTWFPGRPRCLPLASVCDGDKDCADAADELLQTCPNRTCHMDEFSCTNGLCVLLPYHCDHVNDCGDGSDERGCTYPTCGALFFTCGNGACVQSRYVCDGEADCADGSDEAERLCVTPGPSCPPTQFMCASGQCVAAGAVCNGQKDCQDNSDEKGCGINECRSPSVHKCAQLCTDTPTGYHCSCRTGYSLMADGKACADVDECRATPAVCSQLCENTAGSFRCKCAPGYLREPDGRTCRQNSGVPPSLLYSNRYYVRNMTADGAQLSLLLQGLANAVGVDFHHQEKSLYWLDAGRGRIDRMRLDGDGERETLVDSNMGGAEALAVDWVGRKVYWVDSDYGSVHVMELDGRHQKKLLTGEIPGANATYMITRPHAVALNPRYGWLYWTDWGASAFVGRAGMDGSNASAIITAKLEWPSGLTVDYATNKIFFADAHLNFIDFADMDGQNRHRALAGSLPHVFALTLFEDWLFWTDWNTHTVEKAHKYTGAGRIVMGNNTHRPYDIRVHHPYRQPRSENPCESHDLSCSHLCLIGAGGARATCECPDHFIRLMVGFRVQCVADCSSTKFRCGDNEKCVPIWWKCDGQSDCGDGSDEPQTCPPRSCPVGRFQCLDGNCTYPGLLCDGHSDCGDGSDEDPSLCSDHRCLENQFQCRDKRCLPVAWRCDGVDDCGDGSDEDPAGCAARTCGPGDFQCSNGRCVPASYVCDMDDDCGDHSDEPYDTCASQVCEDTEFSCVGNYRCVPAWERCDGINDCIDNSDEDGCEHLTCDPLGDFRCDNHRCVPIRWQCDGNDDCGDGSDEKNCQPRPCSESEFRCDNQQCIAGSWVCNHDNDCGDNSDERDCELHTCRPGYFQCDSGHCFPEALLCDGQADCEDFSDESKCPTRFPGGRWCPHHMFQCANRLCVSPSWVCDGVDDCGDRSDEQLSLCLNISCEMPSRYRCANGYCIYAELLCNLQDNCGDGSDETQDLCREPTLPPCTLQEFKCTNGHCVALPYVCDHYNNCGDLTDEIGCNFGQDRSCEEKLCQHQCTNLNGTGFICSCRPGYRVDQDSTYNCLDINECEVYGACPQGCKNTKGGFQCECSPGYRRAGDGDLCEAEGPAPLLLLPENIRIRRFSLQTGAYHDYLEEQERVTSLDWDWDHNNTGLSMVYFTVSGTESTPGAIKRAYLPTVDQVSSNMAKAVDLGIKYVTRPAGIAVDWVGRNLYWTDSRVRRLEVAMLDGRYRKHLVKTELEQPSAVALNPRLGMLYWADHGSSARIECSWLDGQQRRVLVAQGLGWPTGLSVDFTNGDRLYWSDSKESRIESVLPSGGDRQTALYIDVRNPLSVNVFEDHVYWSTQEKGEVFRQDKFGRGSKVKLLTAGPWLTQVSVYQQQRYNSIHMSSPCKEGVCSHLCLLRPGGYTCACPEGTGFITSSLTECDAGFDPTPTMPPPCRCQNGGICYFSGDQALCTCLPEWTGDFCENGIISITESVGIAIGVAILVLVILAGLVYACRRKVSLVEKLRNSMPSMPSLYSMMHFPSMPGFRNGASTEGSGSREGEDRPADVVPCASVAVGETEAESFANPGYEIKGQAAQGSSSPAVSSPWGAHQAAFGNTAFSSNSDQTSDGPAAQNQLEPMVDEERVNPMYLNVILPLPPTELHV